MNVIIENKYGEQLDFSHSDDYILTSITGLTPPKATINTSTMAMKDGSVFNSSRLENRNIVLTICPNGNIESSRIGIYAYAKAKQYIKVYIKTMSRSVWIDGYVESVEGDLFANPQKLQISIICPDPYLKDVALRVTNFSNVVSNFSFPFALDETGMPVSIVNNYAQQNLYNPSDDETGVMIELYASADQILEPSIYNLTNGETLTLEYEFAVGDRVIINTRRGEKSIIAIRDGVSTNIINDMVRTSDWIKVLTGDNVFSYTCLNGADNLVVSITLQPIYEGV